MSLALRKKIDSANGIPPTLMDASAFWEQGAETIKAWVKKLGSTDASPEMIGRSVMTRSAFRKSAASETVHVLISDRAPALCAIVLSKDFVSAYAAERLKETREAIETVSPLFLKLASEDPARDLYVAIARNLLALEISAEDAPASGSPDALNPDGRFLRIDFQTIFSEQSVTVGLLFELESLSTSVKANFLTASRLLGSTPGKSPMSLRRSVRTSIIRLEAVIDLLALSVGECSRLQPGQIIALPDASLQNLALTAETAGEQTKIAFGELGVWRTQRAVKLSGPINEAFLTDLVNL